MADPRPVALVLRALYLCDFVTCLPALQLLRQALPGHRIVLAAPAGLASLAALSSSIDEFFAVGELQPLTDFSGLVDVAIDLHGNGPASRRLLEELRPRRVVGFAHPASGRLGSIWRPQEHEVHRWCRLVAESFGLPEQNWPSVAGTLDLPTTEVPPNVAIVHPGAKSGARRWPADRFAAVAQELRDNGCDVAVTGSPDEIALAREVSAAAGDGVRPVVDLSLEQLAALVAHASVVVSGDTGIAHLAAAYRTPSVVLFGPVSPVVWGPPADGPHNVLWHGDGTGDPHGADPDPALLRIGVDEVISALPPGSSPDGTARKTSRARVGALR